METKNKKFSIPVNHFGSRMELEVHGLINGIPALLCFVAAFVSYHFATTRLMIGFMIIGILWLIGFVMVTYLYSNARLFVTEVGLVLKKRGEESTFPWDEIIVLKFASTKGGIEPTLPPVVLTLVLNSSRNNEVTVYLYKNSFRSPMFIYYKLLALMCTVPAARPLLPNDINLL
jgi:hypothetical protein